MTDQNSLQVIFVRLLNKIKYIVEVLNFSIFDNRSYLFIMFYFFLFAREPISDQLTILLLYYKPYYIYNIRNTN